MPTPGRPAASTTGSVAGCASTGGSAPGEPGGHRGGRLIWQLADADRLLVAWQAVTWDETARDYERRLLTRFAELHHGCRPFADLSG